MPEFFSLFKLKEQSVKKEEEFTFLGFGVSDKDFAIKIDTINEVIRIPKIFSVPKVPSFIKGVLDLRHSIIPVMDFKERLQEGTVSQKKGRIIILKLKGQTLGILIDYAIEVFHLPLSDISATPSLLPNLDVDFISGMVHYNDHLYMIVDPSRFLTPSEIEKLKASSAYLKKIVQKSGEQA